MKKKILLISLFHPELIRGGAQQVCYELFEELKQQGDYDVTLLASTDQSYPALFKSGARITGFDGRPNEFLFLCRDYDYWWHKLSNIQLIESFVEFLQTVKPEVVHFHHFLTYGVDLISLTRRTLPDAKIVFTLHEYLAMCAADGQRKRKNDGSICSGPSPVRCHQCFPERTPESFFMRDRWIKRHFESVDAFTTPSHFMIEHYVKWGLDRSKVHHVTNGQRNYNEQAVAEKPRAKRNRFGFFGQLVDNKGVQVILDAVNILRGEEFEDFVVEINGENLRYASEARRKAIEAFIAAEAELPVAKRNVHFNGGYHVDQLKHRMSRIDWCIVPSVWEETFCLVVSEAWMFKRPVIASNVGAMAERITDGKDGLLFGVGDARSLADTMKRVCQEEGIWDSLSRSITPPAGRQVMAAAYIDVYSGRGSAATRKRVGEREIR